MIIISIIIIIIMIMIIIVIIIIIIVIVIVIIVPTCFWLQQAGQRMKWSAGESAGGVPCWQGTCLRSLA